MGIDYAELQVTSCFSFLHGASHPEEYVQRAKELGYYAIGLSDINTLAGVVRAHAAALHLGFKYVNGCRLRIELASNPISETISSSLDSLELLVYPSSRDSYGRLCELLTLGNTRAQKGQCRLTMDDFIRHSSGLITIVTPPKANDDFLSTSFQPFKKLCQDLRDGFNQPDTIGRSSSPFLSLAICRNYLADDHNYLESLLTLSKNLNIPCVASNDARYHVPERKSLQDVLTCIREKCTIQDAGFRLLQNAERHLKSPEEMLRLFRHIPSAIRRTVEIAEAASAFSLAQLKYEYPEEAYPDHQTSLQYLSSLAWQGAKERYPDGVPEKVTTLIEQELVLIHELTYEKYFLTCYDIVKFARSKGILCQGRGAAANSAVCFCLGITSVDPARIDLLFARFVSKERSEPPDIDIDFEHERREEVIQYIYQRYGRERAALTAEVITYRSRSAVRDVGKALGLSLELVDNLAKSIHRWTGCAITREDITQAGLNPDDPRLMHTLSLTNILKGFPRHLSQHVGGFIISERPLSQTVPILNAAMPDRTIIEWDKDDIETLGILKIDILALGMLSCIRKALALVNESRASQNEQPYSLATIPAEDPAVYDMLCAADTLGVFQIESRAQMSMLPRLKPRTFYDLVIEVAIVRPGPIQGNMVHPYLKRRAGLEKVHYPDARVAKILGKTLGVPLFQEQAMRLAIVLAQFTPGEAEQLRRAMAAWKRDKGQIALFTKRIVDGMMGTGYSREFAETCVSQLKGFSEYGFPESHAASFALLVYASAWLKRHHPAAFAASLLNSQPMGFYAPSQIISDAKHHEVEVLPIDINSSQWESTLCYEMNSKESVDHQVLTCPKLRLGMALVKGLSAREARLLSDLRTEHGPFRSIVELWLNASHSNIELHRSTLETLAHADAFKSMGLNQRQALWDIKVLSASPRPMETLLLADKPPETRLPTISKQLSMFKDYSATGFSLKAHPMGCIREYLKQRNVQAASTLREVEDSATRTSVTAAGIAICRQRPSTAKGVVFLTLEDETGMINIIIRPNVFERFQKEILSASCLLVCGVLEQRAPVIYINATYIESLDKEVLAQNNVALPNRSYSY